MKQREELLPGLFPGIYLDEIGHLWHIHGLILGSHDTELHLFFPDCDLPDRKSFTGGLSSDTWQRLLKASDDPVIRVTDFDKIVLKAIIRKSQRQVDGNIQWEVFRRDNYTCQYCGEKNKPLTVDHYLAQDFGGETTVANLKTSCRPCNKRKANMTIEEWEQYRKDHNLIWPK